jgi:integrase
MSNWSYRKKHSKKTGKGIWYARKRFPFREADGSIAYRLVERSCGTSSKPEAYEKVREFEKELHDEFTREPAAAKEEMNFAQAAEQYLHNGNSGRFLAPVLREIGFMPVAQIDQGTMTDLQRKLYPNAKPATVNRQLFTVVSAVLRFVGVRADLKRPKGHDRPRVIDRNALPSDQWFELVSPHLSPSKRAVLLLINLHGMRIGEVLEREPADLDVEGHTLSVPDTKSGNPVKLKLCEPAMDAIREMLSGWREDDEQRRLAGKGPRDRPWLFGTANRSNFARDLQKACVAAGVPYYSSHMAGRHSFASDILEGGKSLPFLMQAGRWASLKAVGRYSHLAKSEVADEVRDLGKARYERRKGGKILPLAKKRG